MRTLRQTIEGMPLAFDREAAQDVDAVLQFEVTGDEPGEYHLEIRNQHCTFQTGPARDPTLTITTPSDVWLRIAGGELSGRAALLDGLYEVRGDASLLLQLDELFRPRAAVSLSSTARPAGPVRLAGMHWLAVAFVPWILTWIGVAPVLLLAAAATIVGYRAAVREATWFETATLVSVAGLLITAIIAPAWFDSWGSPTATAALAVIWLAPTAMRTPALSAAYSKWKYVEALWHNSTFLHVNAAISLTWGLTFALQAWLGVATALMQAAATPFTVLRWLVVLPAIVVTARLPRGADRRRITDLDGARVRFQVVSLIGIVVALAALAATVTRP
jgi:putative sterol carrier protein